ncbi:hypothetical protein HPB50_003821 [Hyalomma asiaticum]|uniref:Uncharacterized protein n=1 Tax=Hyalomma asiaticum TaxID=266040 RepID=A0ACB7TE63_HYAAI|nr:hypothetical protein HPB50_003821 [Hyalomma asiaticum]
MHRAAACSDRDACYSSLGGGVTSARAGCPAKGARVFQSTRAAFRSHLGARTDANTTRGSLTEFQGFPAERGRRAASKVNRWQCIDLRP